MLRFWSKVNKTDTCWNWTAYKDIIGGKMKFLQLQLSNFGSYNHLELTFDNQGLVLIQGQTGSGKSTVMDAPVWILYGSTAKQGNADDVRNWTSLDKVTRGTLDLLTPDGVEISVIRERGGPGKNDLYWIENDTLMRGKDLNETQHILNERLGISEDLYTAGAYYNEFSPVGSFFTAPAKDRRALLEKLADLSLATKLLERTTHVRRDLKKTLLETSTVTERLGGKLEQLNQSKVNCEADSKRWDQNQKNTIEDLQARHKFFEKEKASKIEALETKSEAWNAKNDVNITRLTKEINRLDKILTDSPPEACETCGQANESTLNVIIKLDRVKDELEQCLKAENPFLPQLDAALELQNHYSTQLESEEGKINPHSERLVLYVKEISAVKEQLAVRKKLLEELTHRYSGLTHIGELTSTLRAALLTKDIKKIENETNRYLTNYFDAELVVSFSITSEGDIDIALSHYGYPCNYRQLSKGQRGLLKLCFSIAVMTAAANKAGVHFNTLFFDESLDGLDSELKIKAFNLFDELALTHDNVIVIEHSQELKSLFANIYSVTMKNDVSTIEVSKNNA